MNFFPSAQKSWDKTREKEKQNRLNFQILGAALFNLVSVPGALILLDLLLQIWVLFILSGPNQVSFHQISDIQE